jgi:hypothetical protein
MRSISRRAALSAGMFSWWNLSNHLDYSDQGCHAMTHGSMSPLANKAPSGFAPDVACHGTTLLTPPQPPTLLLKQIVHLRTSLEEAASLQPAVV